MNFKEYVELGENISTTRAFTGNASTQRLRRGNLGTQRQRTGNLSVQRNRLGNKSSTLSRVGNLSSLRRGKINLRRKSSEYDMGTRTKVGLS